MRRNGKQGASGRRTGALVTRCLGQASREMGFVGEATDEKRHGQGVLDILAELSKVGWRCC